MLRKLKVYFPKRVLFIINTVIRGAHDNVRTCVISYSFIVKWKSLLSQTCFVYYHCAHDNVRTCVIQYFQSLTYCFVLKIKILDFIR